MHCSVWSGFDEGIATMGRIDDSLVPLHEKLANLYSSLKLLTTSLDAGNTEEKLVKLQRELNQVESDHCVNGKYVPAGWKESLPVPSGQAIISSLVSRCYRIIHAQYERTTVSKPLIPIQEKLVAIIDQLKFIRKNYLFSDFEDLGISSEIDLVQVQNLQEQLGDIENECKDGKFLDKDGQVAPGQGILHQLLKYLSSFLPLSLAKLVILRGSLWVFRRSPKLL